MNDTPTGRMRVGDWLVDPSSGRVAPFSSPDSAEDEAVRVEPKVMEVLLELAASAGEVVSKERLIERVWAETFVGEAALARCISELRRAFGDDARAPRYIETLPKRGYRLIAPVEPLAEPSVRGTANEEFSGRPLWNRMAAAAVVVALFAVWWWSRPLAPSAGPVESVTVLAIRPLGDDAAERRLATGLTQHLAIGLASIDGVSVRSVDTRNHQPDRTRAETARELGVDAFVTGTIQVSGNRTLITLELVQTATELDLWAGSFQEIDEDPLEIEREVAEHATREIAAALAAHNGEDIRRTPADPAARRLLERGRVLADRERPADALRALEHYDEALRIDSGFARAWAARADVLAIMGWNHWSPVRESYARAREAAYEALDLDPRLAEAHAVLGAVAAEANWDWPEAERFFRSAIELDPDSAFVRERYGRFLRRLARADESLAQTARATELEPDWLRGQVSHGWSQLLSGSPDDAERTFLRALEMDGTLAGAVEGLCAVAAGRPDSAAAIPVCQRAAGLPGHDHLAGPLGYVLARAGRERRAAAIAADLEAASRETPALALAEATVLLGLGRRGDALSALETAVDARVVRAAAILADPYLRDLAEEPRLGALLSRMALRDPEP